LPIAQLTKIAKRIYLIEVKPTLTADRIMVEKATESRKVSIYTGTQVKKIYGEQLVQGIEIEKEGKLEDLPVGGIFIEIGSSPASDFAKGVAKNEREEIVVNCGCETNIPGVFAAGDVTNVPAKQIIVACGEGAKACISAFDYVNRLHAQL
jgi:alkyl hydroperoxide reductase subunit F